jgi:predicted glycoside hydrolase/deacetylase ChbG (UPF0249 family)
MRLIVSADDYGYHPAYDAGILEAARVGAIDGAGVMVLRCTPDPGPLADTGIAIGLHLEMGAATLERQVELFAEAFGREPDYLDGHLHSHARGRPAVEVANLARERGWPVRSIDARHRRLLRCKGVVTADGLVGRMAESEPVPPPAIERDWEGVLEWVTHPGHAARDGTSSYDEGREEDLEVLLALAADPRLRDLRTDWRALAR